MRKKAQHATFHWVVKPEDGIIQGTIYTDGSALDGPSPGLMRCGLAFVAVDSEGNITASAYGLPPPWIDDIGGAEAWALLQAGMRALPGGCTFKVDCEPCVKAVKDGIVIATAANKVNARVHGLILRALDDTPASKVIWLPAHKGQAQVGKMRCGDGTFLTKTDLFGNDAADKLAKRAVQGHRVSKADVEGWDKTCSDVKAIAMSVARATHLANNCEVYPYKYSEASRAKADALQQKRAVEKIARTNEQSKTRVVKKEVETRHKPVREIKWVSKKVIPNLATKSRSGWRCSVCRAVASSKQALENETCHGSIRDKQLAGEHGKAAKLFKDADGHKRVVSGAVEWCHICGCFAEHRSKV